MEWIVIYKSKETEEWVISDASYYCADLSEKEMLNKLSDPNDEDFGYLFQYERQLVNVKESEFKLFPRCGFQRIIELPNERIITV